MKRNTVDGLFTKPSRLISETATLTKQIVTFELMAIVALGYWGAIKRKKGKEKALKKGYSRENRSNNN